RAVRVLAMDEGCAVRTKPRVHVVAAVRMRWASPNPDRGTVRQVLAMPSDSGLTEGRFEVGQHLRQTVECCGINLDRLGVIMPAVRRGFSRSSWPHPALGRRQSFD